MTINFKFILVYFLCIVLLFSSCASPYHLRKGLDIETLKVYVHYSERYNENDITKSYEQINKSVERFNQEDHSFDIKLAYTPGESDFIVEMRSFNYATRKNQTTCFILSAVGLLALPITLYSVGSSFIFGFYITPGDKTNIMLKPTPELQETPVFIPAPLRTFAGYFSSKETHIQQHYNKLHEHFYRCWCNFEREYNRKK